MRLKELAASRVRYGYRRLHILLRSEGWAMNHNRTYRLYREEGLSIRPKVPKRKRACLYRQGQPEIHGPNEVWAMDFVSDQLFDGRPFRILTVVDCHAREALSTMPRVSFRAYQVVEDPEDLVRARGCPKSLRVDHGPEFAGRMLDQWACLNGVELDFSPERVVVPVHGRRPGPDRALAKGVQQRATPLSPGRLDAPGLRRPSYPSPETCIAAAPNSGQDQCPNELPLPLESSSGSSQV